VKEPTAGAVAEATHQASRAWGAKAVMGTASRNSTLSVGIPGGALMPACARIAGGAGIPGGVGILPAIPNA